ncbi:hypothetical protein QWY28_17320 [Nocardioides sp. SOB77]|uniref:Phage head morphogenesis domain-containing protein n=1 Tax=Nocardioides oceani TaxID=3058369 RepID=A0ABT8FJQ0_9ACTN|nr:hypothetical protein [Nocardioides oceani]MDN4174725.1 hypothetical protein [Nocardioides oceani]
MATLAEETAAAATASAWVAQTSAATSSLTATTTATSAVAWQGFSAWYAAAQVRGRAAEMAEFSVQAQHAIAGIYTEHVAQLLAALAGEGRVAVPPVGRPVIRNGADLVQVHARPAAVFKETFALTADEDLALARAVERATQIIETDLMLAGRQAQTDTMKVLGVTRYRRVLRPELSESGPCGLCVVAADRIYRVSDLLPMHAPRCKCVTMPIVGDLDPGIRLNREDLKAIYKAAGDSTAAEDLRRTRVQVNEHGELGPVLTVRGQKFTGPDDLGRPPGNPALLQQRLEKLENVLALLTDRDRAGENLREPLAYQRAAIDRSRRRLAAA